MLQVSAFAPHRTDRWFFCSFTSYGASNTKLAKHSRPDPSSVNIKGKTPFAFRGLSTHLLFCKYFASQLAPELANQTRLGSPKENFLTPKTALPKRVSTHVLPAVQTLDNSTHVPGTAWTKASWDPFFWESLHSCVSAPA